MTSYINQTIARSHVAELIAQAESSRMRRRLRAARREERAARRTAGRGTQRRAANYTLRVPNRIGLA